MGMFNDVNDAMGQVGGLLKSPAMSSVDNMKNAATSLNVTANLDQYILEQGFPGHGNAFYQQMQEIQNLSNALDECGNFAQDLIQASTEDYIKSTGIQEAGRDLANTLGQYKDEIDCAAGFATLFDSKGILDDVLGIGDLPQIQSRVQQIVKDVTNPTKLANMITNLDAVQGLLEPFNDFCTGMKDALNQLVAKDLASMNAILNKLAQWAAFTNLATGDPCALVNNSRMLGGITSPVMDDILDLYDGLLDGDVVGAVGDIFAPDIPTALIGGSTLTQVGATTVPFGEYFSTIGTDVGGGITASIGNIVKSSGEQLSEFLGMDGGSSVTTETGVVTTVSVKQIWNGSDWVDDSDSSIISGMQSLSVGALAGDNSFNPALDNFKKMKEGVEFESFNNTNAVKTIISESCRGGVGSNQSDCLSSGGMWSTSKYSPTNKAMSDAAKGLGVASFGDVARGSDLFNSTTKVADSTTETVSGGNVDLNSVENGIDNDLATEEPSGSGADIPSNSSGKSRGKTQSTSKSINRSVGRPTIPTSFTPTPPAANRRPEQGKTPFSTPSYNSSSTGAKVQTPGSTNSFEDNISSFDSDVNAVKNAISSGDFSNITSCRCYGGKVYDTDSSSCAAHGGVWKCQKGISGLKSGSMKSNDMITNARNVELSSVLPTSSAFKGL
jgi:hypothetical protein